MASSTIKASAAQVRDLKRFQLPADAMLTAGHLHPSTAMSPVHLLPTNRQPSRCDMQRVKRQAVIFLPTSLMASFNHFMHPVTSFNDALCRCEAQWQPARRNRGEVYKSRWGVALVPMASQRARRAVPSSSTVWRTPGRLIGDANNYGTVALCKAALADFLRMPPREVGQLGHAAVQRSP